jgi:hypothetical protein
MSSTSRGGVREADDFYETREGDAVEMLERLKLVLPERPHILEPMAGRGALVRLMRKVWPNAVICANEINAERASLLKDAGADVAVCGDLFRQNLWDDFVLDFDIAFTNPAFKFATETAKVLIGRVPHVCLLQRVNWLASKARLPFWQRAPADIGLLPERPSFAASLSCGRYEGRGKTKVKKPCGWAALQYLDAPRPTECPGCGDAVRVSTTDSIEYAWFHFYAGSKRQYFHLAAQVPDEQQEMLTRDGAPMPRPAEQGALFA